MATKRKRRVTARLTRFGSCMRKKLKGRHFGSKKTARRALGAASRACGRIARKKRAGGGRRIKRTSMLFPSLF